MRVYLHAELLGDVQQGLGVGLLSVPVVTAHLG